MTAPLKPWEAAGVSGRVETYGEPSRFSNSGAAIENRIISPASIQPALPPALPPRPCPNRSATNYGGYSGGYMQPTSMGYGGMSGYGSMGGYGGFGGGYGGYGLGNQAFGGMYGGGFNRMNGGMFGDVESRFIQMAEESSRPAFQSIESIVGAVGSIAMMLENTFFAMTSSFRAILGVADNFGRLRTLFAQFWSAFAVFRGINWLIKKLLVLLGIRTEDEFKAWAEASMQTKGQTSASSDGSKTPRGSSWPAALFLAVIAAVPYLVVKMLGSINATIQENSNNPSTWQNPMQALAQYDFHPSSTQEIGFRANQILTIAPQTLQGNLWNSGWLMASVDQKTSGLVPVNYFKIIRSPNATAPTLPPLPAAPITELTQSESIVQDSKGEQTNVVVDETLNNLGTVTLNAEPIVDPTEKCLEDSNTSQ